MIKLIKRLLEPKMVRQLAILFTLFATFLFLFPAKGKQSINIPYVDKIVHIGLFFGLTVLWQFFQLTFKKHKIKRVIVVAFLLILYGTVIEVSQELFLETFCQIF